MNDTVLKQGLKIRLGSCLPNGRAVDSLGDIDRCYFNSCHLFVSKPHKHPIKDHVLQDDALSLFYIGCVLYHFFRGRAWRPVRYVDSVPTEWRDKTLEQFYDRLEECDFETDK